MRRATTGAGRMRASILGVLAEKPGPWPATAPWPCAPGKSGWTSGYWAKKTAVFLTISDTGRSAGRLDSLFCTQALQTLCRSAGLDAKTARLISVKASRTADSILNMPLGEAYLFTCGRAPQKARKYDIRSRERYKGLPEEAAAKPGGPARMALGACEARL